MDRRPVGGRSRVAHVTVAPEFVDRIMLHDLRRLREREDITIISTEGPALARARAEGFRVLTVPAHRKLSPAMDMRTLWVLWRIFRRERFALVHTYAPKAGLLGQIAALLAGVPGRIHGCRGLLYARDTPSWQRLIFRLTDRITGAIAGTTLFLSSADMRYATDERLYPRHRVRLIGSGIDMKEFAASGASRAAGKQWRQTHGFTPSDVVVLTIGRYVADKGFREIAAAAALLRTEHPDVRYAWVAPVLEGEGSVLPESLPAVHGIDDIVRRTGYTEDLIPAYAGADLLLHPSYREGVPRVVMEAAAMGLPVLASDIPGCREVVRHGETALLFPPHSAEAVADTLREALVDREGARRRAQAAAVDVRRRFDQDALSARVWQAHAEQLGGAPDVTSEPSPGPLPR